MEDMSGQALRHNQRNSASLALRVSKAWGSFCELTIIKADVAEGPAHLCCNSSGALWLDQLQQWRDHTQVYQRHSHSLCTQAHPSCTDNLASLLHLFPPSSWFVLAVFFYHYPAMSATDNTLLSLFCLALAPFFLSLSNLLLSVSCLVLPFSFFNLFFNQFPVFYLQSLSLTFLSGTDTLLFLLSCLAPVDNLSSQYSCLAVVLTIFFHHFSVLYWQCFF